MAPHVGYCHPPGGQSIMGGLDQPTMTLQPSERLNIADLFLDERVREGRGARTAIRTDTGTSTYAEVQALANRYAHSLWITLWMSFG